MVQVIEQQSGQRPAGILADSGYCSEKNLAYLAATGQSGRKSRAHARISHDSLKYRKIGGLNGGAEGI